MTQNITLQPGLTVSGQITAGGKAISGAFVSLYPPVSEPFAPGGFAVSGANGNYEITGVTPGTYEARVEVSDTPFLVGGFHPGGVDQAQAVNLAVTTNRTGINFQLRQGARGTVQLVNSAGSPVSGEDHDFNAYACPAPETPGVYGCGSSNRLGFAVGTPVGDGSELTIGPGTFNIGFYGRYEAAPGIAQVTVTQGQTFACTFRVTGAPTCAVVPAGTPGPGLPTATVENGAPNSGDGNGDGTADASQSNVASFAEPDGGYLTLATSTPAADGTPARISAVKATDMPTTPLPSTGGTAQTSLISFTADFRDPFTGAAPATPVTGVFEMFLPAPANRYLKYDSTTSTWTDATSIVAFDASPVSIGGVNRWRAAISIVDNGPFDTDSGIGVIADPAVFGAVTATPPAGGGGAGGGGGTLPVADGGTPTASSIVPVVPARLLDTRPAATVDGQQSNVGRRTAASTSEVQVAGRGNVPTDAVAANVNVVAINAAAPGFLTLYPCGSARPEASTLNYATGQTIANGATIKLGTGGKICVYSDQATDLIVDVTGFIPAA